jgi:uncharacterized protein YbaP (TraB family)
MVWRIEKGSRGGFLVGTAHFFPHSLARPLTALMREIETVIFEGPLDQASMTKIAEYGRQAQTSPSLEEGLDPKVIRQINKEFNDRWLPSSSAESQLQLIRPSKRDAVDVYVRGVRPWMAFFTLWSTYLGWKYSIDMEAFHVAEGLGKKIEFLETVEEQLVALDEIPFERIVDYVNRFGQWKSYKEFFLKHFSTGDLEGLMSRTNRFPTRCESILGMRDTRFFERMIGFFETGRAMAFLGMSHIPSIQKMFLDAGYRVEQTAV